MQPGWALPCSTQRRCLCSVHASTGEPDAPPGPQRASDFKDPVGARLPPLLRHPSLLPSPPPSLQAKPGLGKQQLAQILRAVGQQVMDHGGVVTDIRSYGERRLAYDIRQPGARYAEVGAALAPLLVLQCSCCICAAAAACVKHQRSRAAGVPGARFSKAVRYRADPAAPAPFNCPNPHPALTPRVPRPTPCASRQAAMWQVNFAASPVTLQELDHTLRVDERMLR